MSNHLIPPFASISFLINTNTNNIYTLSLHDALPISFFNEQGRLLLLQTLADMALVLGVGLCLEWLLRRLLRRSMQSLRSEEHTSELQSRPHLVCRLLLEKKKAKVIAGELSDKRQNSA